MEIFRINILPEAELMKREAFKTEMNCCHACGTTLEFSYTEISAYSVMREEACCSQCSTQVLRDHKLQ
jgi:hypothetical protein